MYDVIGYFCDCCGKLIDDYAGVVVLRKYLYGDVYYGDFKAKGRIGEKNEVANYICEECYDKLKEALTKGITVDDIRRRNYCEDDN